MNRFRRKGLRVTGGRTRRFGIAALVSGIGLVAAIAAGASAAASLPVSPTYLSATAAYNGLQVEPARITFTGDGSGFLSGAHARDQSSGIRWTKWTRRLALGTGFEQLNDCSPSCAGGTFHGFPVRIELWRPQTVGGTLVFTRMTIFYTKAPPRGEPRHYTFTDIYRQGGRPGYSWAPPDDQGYCVNTGGLKPAAGCTNIHSLP